MFDSVIDNNFLGHSCTSSIVQDYSMIVTNRRGFVESKSLKYSKKLWIWEGLFDPLPVPVGSCEFLINSSIFIVTDPRTIFHPVLVGSFAF